MPEEKLARRRCTASTSSCNKCGRSFEPLSPHNFSFNSSLGWCGSVRRARHRRPARTPRALLQRSEAHARRRGGRALARRQAAAVRSRCSQALRRASRRADRCAVRATRRQGTGAVMFHGTRRGVDRASDAHRQVADRRLRRCSASNTKASIPRSKKRRGSRRRCAASSNTSSTKSNARPAAAAGLRDDAAAVRFRDRTIDEICRLPLGDRCSTGSRSWKLTGREKQDRRRADPRDPQPARRSSSTSASSTSPIGRSRADALRRRVAAHSPRQPSRQRPVRRALRARRTDDRPASARQHAAARRAAQAARPRQHAAGGRARPRSDRRRRPAARLRPRAPAASAARSSPAARRTKSASRSGSRHRPVPLAARRRSPVPSEPAQGSAGSRDRRVEPKTQAEEGRQEASCFDDGSRRRPLAVELEVPGAELPRNRRRVAQQPQERQRRRFRSARSPPSPASAAAARARSSKTCSTTSLARKLHRARTFPGKHDALARRRADQQGDPRRPAAARATRRRRTRPRTPACSI